jgi:hypothetical protein
MTQKISKNCQFFSERMKKIQEHAPICFLFVTMMQKFATKNKADE